MIRNCCCVIFHAYFFVCLFVSLIVNSLACLSPILQSVNCYAPMGKLSLSIIYIFAYIHNNQLTRIEIYDSIPVNFDGAPAHYLAHTTILLLGVLDAVVTFSSQTFS